MTEAWKRGLACVGLCVMAGCGGGTSDCPADDASVATEDAPRLEDDAAVPASSAFVDGDALDFGAVCDGDRSAPLHVTIANAGEVAVAIVSRLGGADASELSIVSDGDACVGELGPRRTCTVSVVATAASPGGVLGAELELDVGAQHVVVPVSASRASCDGATLMPTPVDFGELTVGERSVASSFELHHVGDALSPPVTGVEVSGLDATQFEIVRDGCLGHALVPGASCLVDVVYAPTSPGTHSASLVIIGLGAAPAALSGRAVTAP